jgi:hypothetical protein
MSVTKTLYFSLLFESKALYCRPLKPSNIRLGCFIAGEKKFLLVVRDLVVGLDVLDGVDGDFRIRLFDDPAVFEHHLPANVIKLFTDVS